MSAKLLYSIIFVFTLLKSGFTQSVWEWRNPLPQGNWLNEVAYCNYQIIGEGLSICFTNACTVREKNV